MAPTPHAIQEVYIVILLCLRRLQRRDCGVKWFAQGTSASTKWMQDENPDKPAFETTEDYFRNSPLFPGEPLLFCSAAFQQVIWITPIKWIIMSSCPTVTKYRPRTAREWCFQTLLQSSRQQSTPGEVYNHRPGASSPGYDSPPPRKITLIDMFSRDWHM